MRESSNRAEIASDLCAVEDGSKRGSWCPLQNPSQKRIEVVPAMAQHRAAAWHWQSLVNATHRATLGADIDDTPTKRQHQMRRTPLPPARSLRGSRGGDASLASRHLPVCRTGPAEQALRIPRKRPGRDQARRCRPP